MDNQMMKRKVLSIVNEWNPLELDELAYNEVAMDVFAALESIDDPSELGRNLQLGYERAFKKWVPIEKCIEVSYKLIALKFEVNQII